MTSTNNKTLLFVFGTRPEFIKMVPLILEAQKNKTTRVIICSTGQHRELLTPLYQFFEIKTDYDFDLMSTNQSLVTLHSEIMKKLDVIFKNDPPDWVLVQGDTTTAHAAAMAAFYNKIRVAHIEAGLRTHDINSPFPEEMNRRAISLVASAHFCPTPESAENLKQEALDSAAFIETTGNTGIDTLHLVRDKIKSDFEYQKKVLDSFKWLNFNNFILVTMHRRESFGQAHEEVLLSLLNLIESNNIDVIFPTHPNPNVQNAINKIYKNYFGKSVFRINSNEFPDTAVSKSGRIFLVNPLEYTNLVFLMQTCRFIMTDSGGLQEEGPSFGKKILVLRESTERPEGIKAGFSELVGTNSSKILLAANQLISEKSHWGKNEIPISPFGDGKASIKILSFLLKK